MILDRHPAGFVASDQDSILAALQKISGGIATIPQKNGLWISSRHAGVPEAVVIARLPCR